MKVVRFIAVLAVVVALVSSCQGGMVEMDRSVSVAQTKQDVIDAWNNNCATYNFYQANPVDAAVVGFMYYGSAFDTDATGLMDAMKDELLGIHEVPMDEDDLLNAVLEDTRWYN